MSVGAVAGTKFYIADPGPLSPSPTWVEIKNVASYGNIKQAFAAIAIHNVGEGTVYSLKGEEEYPNFELTVNKDIADPGQIDLADAASVRNSLYNFKLVENSGATAIWSGEVFGYGTDYGANSDSKKVTTSISIRPDTFTET